MKRYDLIPNPFKLLQKTQISNMEGNMQVKGSWIFKAEL